jgi:hypothetical protein
MHRAVFALMVSFLGHVLDSKYLFFFILSVPQIFRHSFEKISDAQLMREFRIFVGPASVLLQLLMLKNSNKTIAFIKLLLIAYGLKHIPRKDDQYLYNKK